MMKKISIIVPIYNVEKYLKECVDSLLNQDYRNCEIILINDGSSDGSEEICRAYQKKYANIILFSQKNAGLPAARNAGLRLATGDYVSFVDSDDTVHKEMFTKMVAAIEKSNADLAVCNFERFDLVGFYPIRNFKNKVIDYSDRAEIAFFKSSIGPCWNKIYKADVIRKNKIAFESKEIVEQEDYYFEMKYYSHIKRIVMLEDALYFYRIRRSSISNSKQNDDFVAKSLNFINLSSDYLSNNSNKKNDMYLQYIKYQMMAACVNYSKPYISSLRAIYKKFVKTKREFDKEIIDCELEISGIRKAYFKMVFWLLNRKMFTLTALLEKARISRLNSKNNKEVFFD